MGGQSHRGQHGDFTERVETTEIDKDDVDHIGAATARHRMFKIVAGDGFKGRAQHLPTNPTKATTGAQCKQQVAQLARESGFRRAFLVRQVVKHQQHQEDGSRFDGQLRQGQIGGREAHEGQGHNQANDADQHNRQQTLPMQDGGAESGERQGDESQQSRYVGRMCEGCRDFARCRPPGPGAKQQDKGNQQRAVALQRAVVDARHKMPGELGEGKEKALEDEQYLPVPPAFIPGEQRRTQRINEDTAAERQQTHDERRIESMPDRQRIGR